MTDTWRMIASFILVLVAVDLSIGLPYVYGEKGLLNQQLGPTTEFNDDVFWGAWIEQTFYECTSWKTSTHPFATLPACSEETTNKVYIIVTIIVPILALVLAFSLINPKTFIGLLKP